MSNDSWRPSPPHQHATGATLLSGLLFLASALILAAAGYVYFNGDHGAAPAQPSPPLGSSASALTAIPTEPLVSRRVNVLLLGIDQRPGQSVATRTDTMILISVDQDSGQIGIISIPRDLWVPIPGYHTDKINTAHFYGENAQDGGGPPLTKATVQSYFGVPVQYYVRLNFQAFRTFIDAIGGIDLDVPRDINDQNYPDDNCPDPDHCGYAPFYIKAGSQHMDGTTALKYARTRYTDNDFYRERRQQQVILATRKKVMQANMIPVLLLKASLLLKQLSGSLSTDLTLAQMAGLGEMAATGRLDTEHVQQLVVDETMTTETTINGLDVLIPNTTRIQAALHDFFARLSIPPTPVPPTASPNLQSQLAAESARIEVLNGTDKIGLARTTADWLQASGFTVVNVADATTSGYPTSQILDTSQKPVTREALRNALKLPASSVSTGPQRTANGAPDITLILGNDFNLPK